MTEGLIMTALLILVVSIFIGYNLYQGGKEIENDKIRDAGLWCLMLIGLSLIIAVVSYVNMNNALKESKPTKSRVKTYRGLESTFK